MAILFTLIAICGMILSAYAMIFNTGVSTPNFSNLSANQLSTQAGTIRTGLTYFYNNVAYSVMTLDNNASTGLLNPQNSNLNQSNIVVPARLMASGTAGTFELRKGNVNVPSMGTTAAETMMLMVSGIKQEVCNEINSINGIASTPAVGTSANYSSGVLDLTAATSLSSKAEFCTKPTDNSNYYYFLLVNAG